MPPDTETVNVIYPNFKWSHGNAKTLTLIGLQEFASKNGIESQLPYVTFTYGDNLHLTTVNNGQGGLVQMTYQRWTYFDDINKDLRSLFTKFGSSGTGNTPECVWNSSTSTWTISTSWYSSGGTVGCYRLNNTSYLRVGVHQGSAGITLRPIPENVAKPGGRYRIAIDGRSQSGTVDLNWGFVDKSTYPWNQTMIIEDNLASPFSLDASQSPNGAVQFEIPVDYNPQDMRLYLECSDCLLTQYQFALFPQVYRVASRTVTVQPTGATATYQYSYDNAAPNTIDNSNAANISGATLYTPKLREYRGNAVSRMTNPDGLATVNWYHQGDSLKGRSYETLTLLETPGSFDNFNSSIDTNVWAAAGGTQALYSMYQIDFDFAVKSMTSASDWNTSFTHILESVSSGEMAVAHIRLSEEDGASAENNAQGRVGLVGSGGTLEITLAGGAASVNGIPLLSSGNLKKDEWYGVMFFVDAANGSRVRIWQLDDPANSGEAVVSGLGAGSFKFQTGVNDGTIWLDTYFEGVPYAETITRYNTTVQYDTIAGNGIPDLPSLTTFKDLQIAWNTVAWVEQRTYNGDAKYVGTRQEFTYDAPANYGHLLTRQEHAGENNTWALYRGSKIEYASPNTTAYIVNLPARQSTFDCTSGACEFSNETGKVSESISFYDNNTLYTAMPIKGLPTKQRVWIQNNEYSQSVMGYDSYGNPTSQTAYTGYATSTTDPVGGTTQVTTTAYDTAGYNTYPVSVTNALSQTTQTAYDYSLGLPISVTDPNGAITSAEYDGFGRMIRITAPGDSAPTLSISYYDGVIPFQIDLAQRVSDTASIRLSRFYDGAGRQIQTQTIGAVVDGIQKNVVVDSLYDNLGRLVKQGVPNPVTYDDTPNFTAQTFTQSTVTVYDILGRTLSVTQPNGNQVQYSYADLSATVIDPKDNPTTSIADVWGRTTFVDAPTGPDVSYSYDVLGRLVDATRGGVTTTIQYDSAGRKLNMSDPDMGYWQYQYDALGNLKTQTDARGCTLTLDYDALNRLTTKASSGNCSQQVTTSYFYDADNPATPAVYDPPTPNTQRGRRTGMSDDSGSTLWGYDSRGRLTNETKAITGAGSSFITQWTYNSADLPVTMTYPDNEILTYGYNSDGTLNTVTSSLGDSTYLGGMKYDEAGRIKSMEYGAGIIQKTFEYLPWNTAEEGGLLGSVVTTRLSDQTPLQSLAYTYDKNANIDTITDALAGPQTQTFEYDPLNRLTSASVTGGTNGLYNESYSYNAATGNLSVKAGVGYTYDPTHPHAVASLTNGNAYGYDANGNMITRDVNNQDYTLGYDAENRLVSVSTGTQGMAEPSMIRMQSGSGRALDAPVPQPFQQSSFPSTSVLDNFNRANGSLGANWNGAVSGYSISSNQGDVGTGGDIYWQGGSYGVDQEVFVTFTNVDTNGGEQDLFLKCQDPSGWGYGLIEVLYDAGNHIVQVWTYSPSQNWVQRGSDISVTFNNGDQFGARAKSNGMVEVYKNGTMAGSADVSAWSFSSSTTGGYIGVWFINAGSAMIDDFGGGTVSAGATSTPGPTPTATNTSVPPTATYTPSPLPPTATRTNTGVPPTATHTPSPVPPTATRTHTSVPPTATFTLSPASPTATFTPSLTLPPTPSTPIFSNGTFVYDGDGKRVKSVLTTNIATTTTYFVGAYYEVANGVVTKYYYIGSQRIAMRANGDLKFLLGDHLGSTSLVTDATGLVISETRYKAWGEVRHESGTTPTKYTYTGQYSYTADFGLMFYNARWVDVTLGRFAQADTIVPGGIQELDRYAYVNNIPTRFVDPSGHRCYPEEECKLFPRVVKVLPPSKNCIGDCYDAYLTYREVVDLLGRIPSIVELLYMTASTEYTAYNDHKGVRKFGQEGLARNYYEACYDQDGINGCQGDELYIFLSGYQPWMGYSGQPANEPTTPLSRAKHLLATLKEIDLSVWDEMTMIADFSYAKDQDWTDGMWKGQPWQWFGPFDPDKTCNKNVTPVVSVDLGGGQVFWMLNAEQTGPFQSYCD